MCKSLGITKYDPYFTDAETKAWEEWAPNQDSFLFGGFVTINLCAHVGLLVFLSFLATTRVGRHSSVRLFIVA